MNRAILLRFEGRPERATVEFQQDLFLLSGTGKAIGEDKFVYEFGPSDDFIRRVGIRAKKSDNAAGRVIVRISAPSCSDPVTQESVISVSPLWGVLEYLNLAMFWYFIPTVIRRRLWLIPPIAILFLAFAFFFPDRLPDSAQQRLHLAPPDWFDTAVIKEWDDFFLPSLPASFWSLHNSSREPGPPGSLLVRGLAAPQLTKHRDTLHNFYAEFDLEPKTGDLVSWMVRFHPNSFDSAAKSISWSGYLFQLRLKPGVPKLGFYACTDERRCRPLALVPLPTKELNIVNLVQLKILASGAQFSLWGTLNDEKEGHPINIKGVPFEDSDRRFLWGNIAFLSLGPDFEIDPKYAFRVRKLVMKRSAQ